MPEGYLYYLTVTADICAMSITLWMGFYLLARGFPGRFAIQGAIILFALSAFFFGAFVNIFQQIPGTAAIRATLLVITLSNWHSITYQLREDAPQKITNPYGWAVYALGLLSVGLMLSTHNSFVGEVGNSLYVARMGIGLPYSLYGGFQILVCGGIVFNLLSGEKVGLKRRGRYFFFSSLFAVGAVIYGILSLALTPPMPRLIQDLLIFSGVFLLGMSIAHYQAMLERWTTLDEMPLSGTTLLAIAAFDTFIAWQAGLRPPWIIIIPAMVIATTSFYDMVREFLERRRHTKESNVRKQLRQITGGKQDDQNLEHYLREGLILLCETLGASGAMLATRQDDVFTVTVSQKSIPPGTKINPTDIQCDDVCAPRADSLKEIAWLAPAFEADDLIAVIGLGSPSTRTHYSSDDLDLLAEVADRAGLLISLSQASGEGQTPETPSNSLMETLASNPAPHQIKMVEDGLRNLQDYIELGQSPLADWVGVEEQSHVERGKKLHKVLLDAIETLKPGGTRPREPLPRIWHNYVVIYDAYVENIPNREIMARLYISEGTFNRTRRNALRGLTRLLAEKIKK